MKTNSRNLSSSHRRINDSRTRRFERFLEKNKLDNALVTTDSGEVVDLYSEAIWNRPMGLVALIWLRLCRKLSNGFYCIGRFFDNAGKLWLWGRSI